MKKKLCIFTDSGHGGLVAGSDGQLVYTTGMKKRYTHGDNSEALEGVINRDAEARLLEFWDADSRPWIDISSGNLDIPLVIRCRLANDLYRYYKVKYNCLYLSLHSNAGKGTGVEVFTTRGQTKSDEYATIWIDCLEDEFPEFKFRKDLSDGDADKEADFYVLRNTFMPAVLGEFLFFDNYLDWQHLQSHDIMTRYALATYKFLCLAEEEIQ